MKSKVARTDRLRHLVQLRQIEEESHASLLEASTAQLRQLAEALKQTRVREAAGRSLVEKGIQTGETQDRLAGLAEIASATRVRSIVMGRKHQEEENLEGIRQRYIVKRMETRQAETLLLAAEENEAQEQQRRGQSALDEWHRMVQRRQVGNRTDMDRSNELRAT